MQGMRTEHITLRVHENVSYEPLPPATNIIIIIMMAGMQNIFLHIQKPV